MVDLLEWGLFGALNFKLSCPSSIGCCGKLVILLNIQLAFFEIVIFRFLRIAMDFFKSFH